MNPFGTPQTREEKVTTAVIALLEKMREAAKLLDAIGKDFSANDVMTELAAAEALVDVEAGEVAVYGGYDTNDVRRWGALFASYITWKSSNVTTTLANGDTETKTAETLAIRYYAPVE